MSQTKPIGLILESIENKLQIGVIVLSSRGEIQYINPYASKLFHTNGGKTGSFKELLIDSPDLIQQIRSHLQGKGEQHAEMVYIDPIDKKSYEMRIDAYQEKDFASGGIILQFLDISQQRQAETALAVSKENTAALLDSLNDYYFEIDIRGVVTNINQAFCQQLGYEDKNEIVGNHLRHFTDRDSVRLVYQNYQKVFEQKETVSLFRYTYHTRDGRAFIGETTISPILEGDRVVGARGLFRDVTERVRTEENLHRTSEDLEARINELRVINRISNLMSESLNLKQVLHSLCEEFTRIFPIRNAGIGIMTPDKESIEVVAFHSDILEEESLEGMLLPLVGNIAFEEVVTKKKALWIQDAATDPRMGGVAEVAAERGTKSLMIAPLLSRGTAIGTIFLPGKDPEHVFTDKELELAGTIANQIATAIDNAQLFEKIETALDTAQHDLQIGKAIQSGFFPEYIPVVPGWEISTYFEPARYVSGDFYDIFRLGDSKYTAFIIADVCDKGVGAALFMVLFRSLFRAFSRNFDPASDIGEFLLNVVRNTNAYVAGIHGNASMFATVFVGIIDAEDGSIHYVNGGHEPPVLLDKKGSILCRLRPTGPAIGLFESAEYESKKIHLAPGEFLVGYTDGTLDAENSKGAAYSETRFLDFIQAPWTSLFSMVYELQNELRLHAGEQKQFDDITLLTVRRKENPLKEKHGICRVADARSTGELKDFVEAAAIESKLTPKEAISLRSATDMICKVLIQLGQNKNKPGMLSLFFEREAEEVSVIIRDDGAPLGKELRVAMEAELKSMNPNQDSGEPGMNLNTLTYELMEQGGNKLSLSMTRNARVNEVS